MVHQPSPQLKADMKKVGGTLLAEWLKNAGAEGRRWSTPTASRLQTERQGNLPFSSATSAQQEAKPGEVRMRSALDRMYMTAAWLAALLMIGLLINGVAVHPGPGIRPSCPGNGCLRGLHDGGRRIPRACPHTQALANIFA